MRAIVRPWPTALLAGVAIGALAVGLVWFFQAGSPSPAGIVDAGPLTEFGAAGDFPPILYASHAFYLVKLDTGELRALYAYASFDQLMERHGCPVEWHESLPPTSWVDVFRDRCIGNTFSRDGTRLFGPSTHDLDPFRVESSHLSSPTRERGQPIRADLGRGQMGVCWWKASFQMPARRT